MMNYQLEAHENVPDGIRRIMLECIDTTVAKLTDPNHDRHRAVHDARKSFKRIRAVLRLIRDAVGDEVYRSENETYRDASRRLAPVRDGEVLVETLEKLKKRYKTGLSSTAFSKIKQQILIRHEQISQQLLDDENVMQEIAEYLQAARPRLEAIEFQREDFHAFNSNVERVYRRGKKGMAFAYANPEDPEHFHDWRKRVKYLWYQIEILQAMWPQLLLPMAEDLKRVSKMLGDAHDLAELRRVLLEDPETFGEDPELPLLLALLEQQQNKLEWTARPLGNRLYVDSPRVFTKRFRTFWTVWKSSNPNLPIKAKPAASELTKAAKPKPAPKSYISTKMAAEKFGITQQAVRDRIRTGKLAGKKIGQQWVVEV